MITVSQAVERVIAGSSLYGEAMLHDIANYSAISRRILPAVEAILLEPVSEGAVTIALKRYAMRLREERGTAPPAVYPIRNISVRGGLTVMIYRNAPMLQDIHRQILSVGIAEDAFVQFAQGSHESSFVIDDIGLPLLKKLAAGEKLVGSYPRLSAIGVRMPPEVMHIPGIFAPFVQALAWERISVYQIVSHFTEITFIVSDADAGKAFEIVKAVRDEAMV
jgi:hypothetical protein